MQTALREKLRNDLEDMSRQKQLERKQSENQALSDTLNNIPVPIFIGSFILFIINTPMLW
jgi:hypothetical protein